jgi:hypothetical protein
MPWKNRKGSSYYYRSVRRGDRVATEYFGRGARGEHAEYRDEIAATVRRMEAEAWKAERAALDGADRESAGRFAAVGEVVAGMLEAAGLVRHNRGNWRRPRMRRTTVAIYGDGERRDPPAPIEEIEATLDLANKGDKPALARIRKLIRADPALMPDALGADLAWQVECKIAQQLLPDQPGRLEAIEARCRRMRADLAGPDPTPIEKLLVSRIVLTWLEVHSLDFRCLTAGNQPLYQAEYMAKCRDRAHRRYLAAIRTLAAVRKLDVQLIQTAIDARSGCSTTSTHPASDVVPG